MKKLVNPLPAGGVPFNLEDILNLQNVNHDAYKRLLYGVGDCFVLSGVEVQTTNTTTNTCTVSEGWVWISDEIMFVPAYSGAYPFYITPAVSVYTRATLADGTSKNVYVIHSATSTTARPVSASYIECIPEPKAVFKNLVVSKVVDSLNTEITTRVNQVSQEVADRKAAVVVLNAAISNLSDEVKTKVTRKIARLEWVDIDFSTGDGGWVNTTNSGYNKTQYMRTEDGFVHLRGTLMQVSTGGGKLCTLPSGLQPLNTTRVMIRESNGTYDVQVDIGGGGVYATVLRAPSNTKVQISIDGISFYADGPGADYKK